ncbi:MAG: TonB-dependent receptor [Cytophagales bacterium]|nr:TonB-dependent receptor [Cytophagales bacterium]
MIRIVILFLVMPFIMPIELEAQKHMTITGSYRDQYFGNIIADLEDRYNLQFYYDPHLDSTVIDIEIPGLSVSEMLSLITKKTKINFLRKDSISIIATGRYKIEKYLDDEFFGIKTNKQVFTNKHDTVADSHDDFGINPSMGVERDVVEIGDITKRYERDVATIVGYVRDILTGEPIIGASIFKKNPLVGAITDQFGYYTLVLPRGRHEMIINSTGMKPLVKQIDLFGDGILNIELRSDLISLKEVVVSGEINSIDNLQTGFANLNIKNIREIPSIGGEADILKIALTLPGVQSVGEAASGFNVRGGGSDQNLIMLDDVPVYYTNHLFGFFSVFNSEVIADADLYKSGIGAHFGGRISSVFDVGLREGNNKKISISGGISPITGKITIEGPIKKNTSSYIVGIRSTYSDWMLSVLDNPQLRKSSAKFSDFTGKVNHKINDKNILSFSGYHSRDLFKLNSDSLYQYFNSNAILKWRHIYSNRLNSVSSLSVANYNYSLSSDGNPLTSFDLKYKISDYSLKVKFNYFPRERINFTFGLSSTFYSLQPGSKTPLGSSSLVESAVLSDENGLESALFVGSEAHLNEKLSIYTGFRLSIFNRLGPGNTFSYMPNSPMEIETVVDTTYFSANEIIKTYFGPEIRFSGRYKFRSDLSVKASFDRMNQYIHVLSNTIAISPMDSWRLSNQVIKPQIGNQYSFGIYKTFLGTSFEMSIEGYYKRIFNLIEYKDDADLILNEVLETDVINADGRSYGLEFLIKKKSGKLSGWLSYSYARSLIRTNSKFPDEQINAGKYYPSNYDKPHSFTLVSNYKFNRRINISLNCYYSTGRPATFPAIKYILKGQPVLYFTDRNKYRIPDYFRTDLAINIDGNHKVHKKIHGSWSLSVYNLTSRANAYSVFFVNEGEEIKGYKLSIFKNAIPTITYHFQIR